MPSENIFATLLPDDLCEGQYNSRLNICNRRTARNYNGWGYIRQNGETAAFKVENLVRPLGCVDERLNPTEFSRSETVMDLGSKIKTVETSVSQSSRLQMPKPSSS